MSVSRFIADLGSASPTPGGGAAAAIIGAVAASLVGMVAGLSAGRRSLEPYSHTIRRGTAISQWAGPHLLALADRDAEAFEAFMAAWRKTRRDDTPEGRTLLSAAALVAVEPPREILRCSHLVGQAAERLAGRSNPSLASDLVVASRAVEAAAHAAAENVYVNLANILDPAAAETLRSETRKTVFAVEKLARATRRHAAAGVMRDVSRLDRRDPLPDLESA